MRENEKHNYTRLYDFLKIIELTDWTPIDEMYFEISIDSNYDKICKMSAKKLKETYADYNVCDYDLYHKLNEDEEYYLVGWLDLENLSKE